MALHPNKTAKVRRAKRCCGDSRGAASVIASTVGKHLLASSTNCARLPPCVAVTAHTDTAGPTNAPGGIAAFRASCPKLLDSGFLAFQPATKSPMSPGAFSPPGLPGSPPGGPGEVPRLNEVGQDLVWAHTSLPGPPLVQELANTQLPSVTRCASELQCIEILGHHVLGHLVLRVGRHQQEIHRLLMLVIVLPGILGRHIIWQHDSPTIPQTNPRELEPAHMSCASWTFIEAAGQLRQRGEQFRVSSRGDDIGGVQHLDTVHPASVCGSTHALSCQPLHVVFEFQKRSRMQDLRLSGCRNVDAWESSLHTRSPLVYIVNQPIEVL